MSNEEVFVCISDRFEFGIGSWDWVRVKGSESTSLACICRGVLTVELGTVDGLSSRAIVSLKVTALDHELGTGMASEISSKSKKKTIRELKK